MASFHGPCRPRVGGEEKGRVPEKRYLVEGFEKYLLANNGGRSGGNRTAITESWQHITDLESRLAHLRVCHYAATWHSARLPPAAYILHFSRRWSMRSTITLRLRSPHSRNVATASLSLSQSRLNAVPVTNLSLPPPPNTIVAADW